ncbi:hypothetical protein ACIQLJ_00255 [Microbacterium sp. NPDC091313]
MKKRILLGAGALALAAVPAVVGLWGNASFAESVPVRVPASGQVATAPPSASPTAAPAASTPAQVDDNGGDVPRDERVEPGDDRGGVDDGGGDDHHGGGHGGDD